MYTVYLWIEPTSLFIDDPWRHPHLGPARFAFPGGRQLLAQIFGCRRRRRARRLSRAGDQRCWGIPKWLVNWKWKIPWKWMISVFFPILGNLHIFIFKAYSIDKLVWHWHSMPRLVHPRSCLWICLWLDELLDLVGDCLSLLGRATVLPNFYWPYSLGCCL